MPYSPSIPRKRWLGPRRESINTLATAHAAMGEVEGRGRPLEIGRPVAHAYVLRAVAEFQAFTRDLHDLAAEKLVDLSAPAAQFRPLLIAATTENRFIDRGNADLRSLQQDLRRIGVTSLRNRISSHNARWDGDRGLYQDLIELRNALAHGNQGQLDQLRARGVDDTVTWTRRRLPSLNRTARALDHVVWDHLMSTFGTEPW